MAMVDNVGESRPPNKHDEFQKDEEVLAKVENEWVEGKISGCGRERDTYWIAIQGVLFFQVIGLANIRAKDRNTFKVRYTWHDRGLSLPMSITSADSYTISLLVGDPSQAV